MANREKKTYSIKVVEKALDMLESFSHETGEFSIAHVAQVMDISRASAFRLMATFEHRGYVERSLSSDRYRVGVAALETSQNLLLSNELLRTAKPIMERLARECDEASYLCIPKQGEVLLLDMVTSSQKVQIVSLVGKCYPYASLAAGRVIQAHSLGDRDETPAHYQIRNQGFDLDLNWKNEEIGCCAVPIFNRSHKISGSLCLIGPSYRMLNNQGHMSLLPRVISAGQLISAKLGHSGLDLKPRSPWSSTQERIHIAEHSI